MKNLLPEITDKFTAFYNPRLASKDSSTILVTPDGAGEPRRIYPSEDFVVLLA